MVVGASSDAGKSLLVTALCRFFSRRGLRVQPFKAQNMSLNAYVTMEGKEIGTAQKLQAEAAGILPSYRHNPILLKPQKNAVSQVIVAGKKAETLSAREYYKKKDFYFQKALECFWEIEKESDLVILEGAGSPVELNLMEKDIVNLPMARAVGARIVLVVNIERGGFFAAAYGTLALMPEEDRKRVVGVVVNMFRGDASLFLEGLKDFEKKIGLPILGVLPFLEDLHLEEEDSMALSKYRMADPSKKIQLRILALPHLSNYGEFQIFNRCPDIGWCFTENPKEVARADILILPGSKMTAFDLAWLKEKRLDEPLISAAVGGKTVVGVCGGFQMLGKTLRDPEGVEDGKTVMEGLGLFDMDTVFKTDKKLFNVEAVFTTGKKERLRAYELHLGEGLPRDGEVFLESLSRNGRAERENLAWKKNRVYGTYLHGFFENRSTLSFLFGTGQWPDAREEREREYDRLADLLEEYLDLNPLC
jgi:adenosylcobyric acid synthase